MDEASFRPRKEACGAIMRHLAVKAQKRRENRLLSHLFGK